MPYFNREFPVLGGGNSGERLPPHMEGKDPPVTQHGQRPMMRNMRKYAWLHLLFCTKKIRTVLLKRFSIECRKTKSNPITYQLDYSPNLKP